MSIRSTEPDAAAGAFVMARTVLGCVEGRLDKRRNFTSVSGFVRLVRGFAAHGFAGHLAERRPVSARAALALPSSGTADVERLRSALGEAFEAAFDGEALQDAVDKVEFCLSCLILLDTGQDGHAQAVCFLHDLVRLLETPTSKLPDPIGDGSRLRRLPVQAFKAAR